MLRSGREIQPFACLQGDVSVGGMEDDRPFEAEQDLVVVVLVPTAAITRAVAPAARG